MSATTANFPVSTRTRRAINGAKRRYSSGGESYDIAPPGGESLKDTLARVKPYYDRRIWPQITQSKNVIIAAHGNSLRALVMILEGLSGDEILQRELATGAPILYRLGADGRAIDRKDLLPARSLAAAPEDRII